MENGPISLLIRTSAADPGKPSARAQLLQEVLGVIFPRDAGKLIDLKVEVSGLNISEASEEELLAALLPDDLCFLLHASGRDSGVCVVSAGLWAGIVENLIFGQVTDSKPEERKPTQTDAAIVGEMLDRWLSSADRECSEAGMPIGLNGYRRDQALISARACELEIEPGGFDVTRISLSLGEGVKTGSLTVYLPQIREKVVHDTKAIMRRNVHEIAPPLSAILTRRSISYDHVQALQVGDVIDIPLSAMSEVALEAKDGSTVTKGRLGQMNGLRAVRLMEGASPASSLSKEMPASGIAEEVPNSELVSPSAELLELPESEQVAE